MAKILYFETSGLTIGASGASGYLLFAGSGTGRFRDITADSSQDWLHLGEIDLEGLRIPYTATTNGGSQRTATVTIEGKYSERGSAYEQIVSDYATITQNSASATNGSISVSTSSIQIPSEGSGGTVEFTTNGILTSTIGVQSDTTEWFVFEGYTESGFTWSAGRNNTSATRYARVTISGRQSGAQDYAYAYVGFVQPSMSDVGYIIFDTNTERPASSGATGITNYSSSTISAITSVVCSESWLHDEGHGTLGTLNWSVDPNPYSNRRNGYITVNAQSLLDGSLISANLYFEQEAQSGGSQQVGSIYIYPGAITTDDAEATNGSFSIAIHNMVSSSLNISYSGGNWDYVTLTAGNTLLTWRVNDATNTEGYTTSVVSITGTDISGNTVEPVTVSVLQPPYIEIVEFPIWKDTDIYINSSQDYVDYIVNLDGNIVYSGRAYTLGDSVKIRLNTIMENVLVPYLNIGQEGLQDNNSYADATLLISLDGEHYMPYRRIRCYADWSYRENYSNIISRPIKKEIDKRQLLVCSAFVDEGGTMVVGRKSGASTQTSVYNIENRIGTLVQYAGGADSITATAGGSQVTYLVVDSCKRYCLYYLNAVGGWDSFLFSNISKEKDSFVRSTFKRLINNTKPQHGTVEYKNAITKSWSLRTGYLTDAQSLNLAENLMGSPCAYLHDLETGEIFPVIITTKSTDYQTFYRNGRRFSSYTIDVELAQDRKRR